MSVQKLTPNTDGLEVREIVVNGDDPCWLEDPYYHSNATVDFPVEPGRRIVRYVLLPHWVGTQLVINDIERRHLTLPDRAAAKTIWAAHQPASISSICAVVEAEGRSEVRYVRGYPEKALLSLGGLMDHCYEDEQFVAVVSVEPLS